LAVGKRLEAVIRQAIEAGQFLLVLAGGCDVSKGLRSNFHHGHCAVVWFDAQHDFNTPETTTQRVPSWHVHNRDYRVLLSEPVGVRMTRYGTCHRDGNPRLQNPRQLY